MKMITQLQGLIFAIECELFKMEALLYGIVWDFCLFFSTESNVGFLSWFMETARDENTEVLLIFQEVKSWTISEIPEIS